MSRNNHRRKLFQDLFGEAPGIFPVALFVIDDTITHHEISLRVDGSPSGVQGDAIFVYFVSEWIERFSKINVDLSVHADEPSHEVDPPANAAEFVIFDDIA